MEILYQKMLEDIGKNFADVNESCVFRLEHNNVGSEGGTGGGSMNGRNASYTLTNSSVAR